MYSIKVKFFGLFFEMLLIGKKSFTLFKLYLRCEVKKIIKILFLITCFFTFQLGYNQLSKKHFIPPLATTSTGNNAPNEQWFHISTPSENPVNFTVKRGDGTIFYSDTVSNTQPWTQRANQGGSTVEYGYLFASEDETDQPLTQHGFIIEADQEIYVSTRFISQSNNHGGALVSKGESALGNRFWAGSLQVGGNGHMSFLSFMATENNTFVTVNLRDGVPTLSGQTGTINVGPLNVGQSYVIAVEDNYYGVIGTLIESTNPIVVNSGSGVGSFSAGVQGAGGQDFGVDQIVGSDLVGSEYIFVKGNGNNSWENVLIIADQNNTAININGSPYIVGDNQVILNQGDYLIIEGDKYVNRNLYVSTDNKNDKLFAYQGLGDVYTGFNGAYPAANQGMVFVPPLSCGTSGNVNNIADIDKVGEGNGSTFDDNAQVSFVTTKGSIISINGAQINEADNNVTRNDVLGNGNYESYIITNLSGNIRVESNGEMYVSYYNTNGAASTAGFYSGFTKPPKFEIKSEFAAKGNCVNEDGSSNIELSAEGSFASYEWEIKNIDGSFSTAPGNASSNPYSPSKSGTYRLKGVLECDIELFSDEIRISICPADFDNDGVIDNIDKDLDNDGISNFYESRGNGNIDFSDPLNPIILLSDESISGIISGAIDKTNDNHAVTGATNSFESQVEPGADQELKYTLNFTEKLNILWKDSGTPVAYVDGESFIIRSIPGTSNITLLDPDNNLDIDAGSGYETDILQYTGNEIKFRFKNPRQNNATYEFHANQIDGIELVHKLNNVGSSSESILVPDVSVVNYKLDTDQDGTLDMYDYDSDGDGCKDVIEAGYTDQDDDGVFGLDAQTTENGKVNTRGEIISPDYDPTAEPGKDNTNSYYFQTVGEAPTISLQPQSVIACQIGESVQFSVTVNSNDSTIYYKWFVATVDDPNTWTEIEDESKYSGSKTSTLTIDDVQLNMSGNKYRVEVNTDNYACVQETNDNVELLVEEALPTANTINDLIKCDDNSFGDDADGIITGWNFKEKIADILNGVQNIEDLTVTFHTSTESANDLTDNGIINTDNYTNDNSPTEQEIFVRVRNN